MTSGHWRHRKIARIGIAGFLAALLLSAVSGATALARNPLKLPDTQYEPATWATIDGWAEDDHNAAFAAFLISCKAILPGAASRAGSPMRGALYKICQQAVETKPAQPGEARAFFEQHFRPMRISPLSSPEREGFLTGYYEPIVEGVRTKGDGYNEPLYRKPPGLLPGGRMAVAGAPVAAADDGGKKKKKGKHGAKRRYVSFHDRTAIENGALAGRDLEICWLKDPIDSFFAQIQGSLRVQLDDGKLMRLNYAAANGHAYYAVGRWLIDRGIIPKDEMSMDRIREWMERNPKEGEELRRRNKSYVFFRETHLPANEEPIGAQGISLTPGRSIAVDRKLHTYGTPFFISAYLPIEGLTPDTWFKRLMIAQDTGGAIVGPARADLYFGAGDEAASVAGRIRHYGKFVMLLPKSLDPSKDDEDDDEIPSPRPRPTDLVSDGMPADAAETAADAMLEAAKFETGKAEAGKPAAADAKGKAKANAKVKALAKTATKTATKTAAKTADKPAGKTAGPTAEKTPAKTADKKKAPDGKTSGKKGDSKKESQSGSRSRHDPPT